MYNQDDFKELGMGFFPRFVKQFKKYYEASDVLPTDEWSKISFYVKPLKKGCIMCDVLVENDVKPKYLQPDSETDLIIKI